MIDRPGIYTISAEEYHADPCPAPSLSNSIAQTLLNRSPKHAWMAHPRLNPKFVPSESSRFDLGSAAHTVLLEGGWDRLTFVDADDWRTKAAKDARDVARTAGKFPVLKKHEDALKEMVGVANEAISRCADLSGMTLAAGKPEQTVIWEEDGIWLRSRDDWLANDYSLILDYKTSDSAEPDWFSRQIGRMGYDFQEAFYRRGIDNICPGQHATFIFLAQEIEPPYACSFHGIAPSLQAIADAKVELAIRMWRECMKRNEWPAYTNRICWTEASSWQMAEHERYLQTEGA